MGKSTERDESSCKKMGMLKMDKSKNTALCCEEPVRPITTPVDHKAVVESVHSIILSLDEKGRIFYMNPFALDFFGFRSDEVLGLLPSQTFAPHMLSGPDMVSKINQAGSLCFTSPATKKDGSRSWISWTNKGMFNTQGRLVQILAVGNDLSNDVTDEAGKEVSREHLKLLLDRKSKELDAAFSDLEGSRNRLMLMGAISSCIIQEKSVSLIISRVLEKITQIIPGCGAAYIRHYENAVSLTVNQAFAPDTLPDIRYAVIDIRQARSEFEALVRGFRTYIFSDTVRAADHKGFDEFVARTGIRSGMVVPTHNNDRLLGYLFIYSLDTGTWNAEELELLEQVAGALAEAIVNRISQKQIIENDMRLREAQRIAGLGDFERNVETLTLTASSTVMQMFDRQPGTSMPFAQFLACVSPEDRVEVETQFEQAIRLRTGYNMEYRVLHESGEEKIVSEIGQVVITNDGKTYRIGGIIQDITEQKKFKDEIELARKVFDNAMEGVMVTNVHGTIEFVNKGFTTITGYSREEALGKDPGFLKSGRHDEEFYEKIWQSLEEQGYWAGEIWNRRKTGESYPEQLSITAIADNWGKPFRYISVFSDLSDLREREEQLKFQANYDALTGLPNRTLLQDRIQMAIYRVSRNKEGIAVIFVDMDDFKHVNDSLGHAKGDLLLQQFAGRLLGAVRSQDTVARYGGDEFVILIPDTNDKSIIVMIIERIQQALQKPVVIDNSEFYLRTSMGVTVYPRDGETPDSLIASADMAMYRSKEKGKGRYSFFTEELNRQVTRRVELETDLRHALARNEFTIFLQPKLGAKDHKICGAEALIRWHHPEKGMVSPAEFIPLAEETGLINPIGSWLIDQACIHSKACSKVLNQHFTIAVNISARQAKDGDLVGIVQRALVKHQVPCQCLEVEITESVVMGNVEKAKTIFRTLHDMGIKITIDDFGTGYSSLSYLRLFPVATLKIDKSFVDDIPKDKDSNAMVTTIISMARNLNLTTVAEGVEEKDQLEFLQANHCDQVQGYYFAKPMPVDNFLAYLRKSR